MIQNETIRVDNPEKDGKGHLMLCTPHAGEILFRSGNGQAGRPASAGIIIEIDRSEIEGVNRGDKVPLSKGLNDARVNVTRKDIPFLKVVGLPLLERKVQHCKWWTIGNGNNAIL